MPYTSVHGSEYNVKTSGRFYLWRQVTRRNLILRIDFCFCMFAVLFATSYSHLKNKQAYGHSSRICYIPLPVRGK